MSMLLFIQTKIICKQENPMKSPQKRILLWAIILPVTLTGCTFLSKPADIQPTTELSPPSSEEAPAVTDTEEPSEMKEEKKISKTTNLLGDSIYQDENTNVWIESKNGNKLQLTENGGTTSGCGDQTLFYASPVLSDDSQYALLPLYCESEATEIYIKEVSTFKVKKVADGKTGEFIYQGSEMKIKVGNKIYDNPLAAGQLQTYTNDVYNYKLQYPEDKASIVLDSVFEKGTEGNPGFRITSGGHFAIGVWPNPQNFTAREWIDDHYAEYSGGWLWGFKGTTVGSKQAFSALRTNGCYTEWIIIPHNDKMYTLGAELCDENYSGSLETFKEIVASFKLTS